MLEDALLKATRELHTIEKSEVNICDVEADLSAEQEMLKLFQIFKHNQLTFCGNVVELIPVSWISFVATSCLRAGSR